MKTNSKRLLVFFLSFILISATNAKFHDFEQSVVHANSISESTTTVLIDGEYVTYIFSSTAKASSVIIEYSNGKEDDIITITNNGQYIINNEKLPLSTSNFQYYSSNINQYNTDSAGWKYMGGGSHKITWEESTNAAIVLGLIAAGASKTGVPASHVVTALASAASIIAAQSNQGVFSASIYEYNYLGTHQIKYVWSFKPNGGNKYGPYTNIQVLA